MPYTLLCKEESQRKIVYILSKDSDEHLVQWREKNLQFSGNKLIGGCLRFCKRKKKTLPKDSNEPLLWVFSFNGEKKNLQFRGNK